jgi:type VI protein secretion system component VasA
MIKFSIKILLLISTLLFGLVLGIQQAEYGIFSIEGVQKEQQESFYVKQVDQDHVEVAVLGESFSTKEWEEKQEKWKDRYHHNKISHIGNKLGDTVYFISRKGAEWFSQQMDKFL